MERIDEEFATWINREQPIKVILGHGEFLTTKQMEGILRELRRAFVGGYGLGIAAEASKFPPES